MTSQRTRSLLQEYTDLIDSIKKDMQLVCTTAATNKKVLQDNPDLIDDAYMQSSIDTLKELFKVKSQLEHQKHSIQTVISSTEEEAEEPSASRLLRCFENEPPLKKTFPELRTLASIFRTDEESSSTPAHSGGSRTSGKRKRKDGGTDELEIVEQAEKSTRIDPLTQCPIRVPVRNKRCKHYYCYETILNYIGSTYLPRCPLAGCSLAHIREDDLEFVSCE